MSNPPRQYYTTTFATPCTLSHPPPSPKHNIHTANPMRLPNHNQHHKIYATTDCTRLKPPSPRSLCHPTRSMPPTLDVKHNIGALYSMETMAYPYIRAMPSRRWRHPYVQPVHPRTSNLSIPVRPSHGIIHPLEPRLHPSVGATASSIRPSRGVAQQKRFTYYKNG